jgi:lipid-binding SYLF domain-containing protein
MNAPFSPQEPTVYTARKPVRFTCPAPHDNHITIAPTQDRAAELAYRAFHCRTGLAGRHFERGFSMKAFAKLAAGLVLAAASVFTLTTPARASDETRLLAHASQTVDDLRHSPNFGDARRAMRGARAVLIVPSLVKGGFIFGAEGGSGVLLARTRGGWSNPAFYTLGSASFGLQAGLQKAEVIMIINSDRALRAIERSKFKLGAGAGITVVNLGAGVEGATSGNLQGDIIVWSQAEGVYGGVSLNGSVVAPDDKSNGRFYGVTSVEGILAGGAKNPSTAPLRSKLARSF